MSSFAFNFNLHRPIEAGWVTNISRAPYRRVNIQVPEFWFVSVWLPV